MGFLKSICVFLATFVVGYSFSLLVNLVYEYSHEYREFSPQAVVKQETVEEPKLEVVDDVLDWVEVEDSPNGISLLEIGNYHGDEVDARSGEKWLGLFKEDSRYVLRTTKVEIRRVYDDIVDYKTKNKTGKSVAVEGNGKPEFIVKNTGSKEGAIQTLFRGKTWRDWRESGSEQSGDEYLTYLKKGFEMDFKVEKNIFSLKTIEALNQENEKTLALILEGKGKRQVLRTGSGESGEVAVLYWVGDLDRDGTPDFYLDISHHYNTSTMVLYLSTKANSDQIVGVAAVFGTSGC